MDLENEKSDIIPRIFHIKSQAYKDDSLEIRQSVNQRIRKQYKD